MSAEIHYQHSFSTHQCAKQHCRQGVIFSMAHQFTCSKKKKKSKKRTQIDIVTSKVGQAVIRNEELMIPGEAYHHWPFPTPVTTKGEVHISATFGVNLPFFAFPVSANSKDTRCSSLHLPPFFCDFSRWLSAGRSSLRARHRLSVETLRVTSVKNTSLINKTSKVFNHALHITALSAVYNNFGNKINIL